MTKLTSNQVLCKYLYTVCSNDGRVDVFMYLYVCVDTLEIKYIISAVKHAIAIFHMESFLGQELIKYDDEKFMETHNRLRNFVDKNNHISLSAKEIDFLRNVLSPAFVNKIIIAKRKEIKNVFGL